MPEIATLAGLERLDMMLNDCMYGILFRDINPRRTFVDQRFCRQIHARAGIVINTGEDNYLTTADAVDAAHTVIVSQLLNEYFATEAGLADWQLGLGHAFEINPAVPRASGWSWRTRSWFASCSPTAPLKYMPPTKHMTGDIFAGYLLDAFFNLVGVTTGQGIMLVGHDDRGGSTPRSCPTVISLSRTSATCATPPVISPRTSDHRQTGSSRPAPGRCSPSRSSFWIAFATRRCSPRSPRAPSG